MRIHSVEATQRSTSSPPHALALRMDPYFRVTARAHPDLRDMLAAMMIRTLDTELTVIHGDVSPKNVLVGPHGPVLLDAECMWFGDPAFDVAFCVNHLLIKTIRLPERSDDLIDAAQAHVDAYVAHVTWEPSDDLLGRVVNLLPALALARVDGSSPVEYLDRDQRSTLRVVFRELLLDPSDALGELSRRWVATASQHAASAPCDRPQSVAGHMASCADRGARRREQLLHPTPRASRRRRLRIAASEGGLLVTLSQVGYLLGLVAFVPLDELVE